jgi:hypothetical protein
MKLDNMTGTINVHEVLHEGDEVVLRAGTYQGTPGTFLRLREDANWADVAERNGVIRCHPVAWLTLSATHLAGSALVARTE